MKCRRARKMLVDYANEVLGPEDSRLVQEHVAGCDSCHRELDVLKEVLGLTDDVKVEYPPASVWESFVPDLHRRIESEAALAFRKRQGRYLYLLPRWAASAAAVVLILLTSVILRYYPSRNPFGVQEPVNIEMAEDSSLPSVKDSSEPVLVAGIISKVLITEAQAAELEKLERFTQSELLTLPYHYDDVLVDMSGDVSGTEDDSGIIQFLLESEFAEFDENTMVESDDSEFERM